MTVEILVLLGGPLSFRVVLRGDCPCVYFRRQVDFAGFFIHKVILDDWLSVAFGKKVIFGKP
jgi:hypothetical protein